MPRTYKPVPPAWRPCLVCQKATKGNAKKRYCSNRCRQTAKRARSGG